MISVSAPAMRLLYAHLLKQGARCSRPGFGRPVSGEYCGSVFQQRGTTTQVTALLTVMAIGWCCTNRTCPLTT